MATSCPIGLDAKRLREQVSRTYDRVAADPASGFHFDVGPRYAVEVLGYPREETEAPPVDDASFDYVLASGVVNLAPDKPRVFGEVARVLRPGGQLFLADVAPRVQWLETFVANDKVYCVFLAESADVIEEHARRTGFPANRIELVRGMIDPTYAPA